MQKKILWGVAALVLLFVFAGCSQPTDYTIKTGKIENPGSLKATVYEGLVLLTWAPVADAEEYQVWRSYNGDKTQPQNKPQSDVYLATVKPASPKALAHLDFVSWANQLRDNEEYVYTVISVSGKDNSLNGSSKTGKIKPKIPAALTATLSGVEVGDGAVTITNGQPNLKYTIAQTYGNAAITRTFEKNNLSATGEWYNQVIRTGLLPIKGKYTVTVKGAWAGPDKYYEGSAGEWSQAFDEPVAGGITVEDFHAVRNSDGNAEVDFDWESNGSTFAIYKAELSELSDDPTDEFDPDDGIIVKSDWTPVSITAVQDSELLGGKWRAKETGLASVEGKYIYAIIVDDGADYDFDVVDDWSVTVPSFDVKVASYGDDEVVLITWNDAGTGVTYKLERSEIANYKAGPPVSFNLVGDFVNITPTTLYYLGDPDSVPGRRAVVEDKPATGKEYIYRLTTTKSGVSDYKLAYLIGEDKFPGISFEFGNFVDIQITTPGNEYNTNQDADTITLSLKVTTPATGKADVDYPITLYRRLNHTAQVYESAFATVGSSLKFEKDKDTWTFKDTLPALNLNYTYLLSINGQWLILNNVQALGSYQPLTNYTSGQQNWTASAVAISGSGASTAPQLPAWSKIIASGTTNTGNTAPTTDSWSGPNLKGQTLAVKYTSTVAAPNTIKPATVTVGVVSATIAPTAPATNTVVEYYYYITLPNDIDPASGGSITYGSADTSWITW